MKEYMMTLFAVSLILGVLEALLYKPGGRGERAAFAVLLAFSVLSPIEGLMHSGSFDFPAFSPEEGEDVPAYEARAREAFEEGIASEISAAFGVKEEYVRVRAVNFSFAEMRAEKILVTLSFGAAGCDPERVKEYIEKLELGECEVGFEIG